MRCGTHGNCTNHVFICRTTKGIIKVYDIRQTGGPVAELDDIIDDKVPVHSVVPIPPMPGLSSTPGAQRGLGGALGLYFGSDRIWDT